MQDQRINKLLKLAREEQEAGNLRRAATIYSTVSKYLSAASQGAADPYLQYLFDFITTGAD